MNPMDMVIGKIFGNQQQFNQFMRTGQMNQNQQVGFNQALNAFGQNFQQQMPNQDPQQIAMQLINSGQMSPQMFENCRKIANSLTGMNK